jgi:Sec-independent protein secretion pathway component TatC
MSLQLEQDAKVPMQTHIDEFSSRFAIMIFIWIVVSIFWIINIDVILEKIIRSLDPCVDECSNLYNPAKWSEIRWLSGALLGFISICPLLIYQIYVFSRPGMMKREANWLLTWLVVGSIAFVINIILTLFVFIPFIFEIGHSNQVNLGFVAKYDVVAMIKMAMAVIWVEVLIISGIIALVTAGLNGLMHKENSRWWRLRVHGIISMLFLLSFYGQFTLSITLMGISFVMIELISLPWIRSKANMLMVCPVIFDEFGITRKILFAQCECDNQYTISENFSTNKAFKSFRSICKNKNEKEELYQLIDTNKFTDFVLFGCSSITLKEQIENNLFTSKCQLRTELFNHNSSSFSSVEHYSINTQFLLASIVDPWSINQVINAILSLTDDYQQINLVICGVDFNNEDLELKDDEVIVRVTENRMKFITDEFDRLGRKYRLVEA